MNASPSEPRSNPPTMALLFAGSTALATCRADERPARQSTYWPTISFSGLALSRVSTFPESGGLSKLCGRMVQIEPSRCGFRLMLTLRIDWNTFGSYWKSPFGRINPPAEISTQNLQCAPRGLGVWWCCQGRILGHRQPLMTNNGSFERELDA